MAPTKGFLKHRWQEKNKNQVEDVMHGRLQRRLILWEVLISSTRKWCSLAEYHILSCFKVRVTVRVRVLFMSSVKKGWITFNLTIRLSPPQEEKKKKQHTNKSKIFFMTRYQVEIVLLSVFVIYPSEVHECRKWNFGRFIYVARMMGG